MNHDYAHCLDYTTDCPKECFRAQLQRDLEKRRSVFIGVPLTYSHLGGTVECKLATGTCKDTISRQAAIEAINHVCPVDTEYDCTLLDRVDVRCVLLDLPSAQRWIPVSERMPEKNSEYLVTEIDHITHERLTDIAYYGDFIHENNGFYKANEIVAWMPLPEPWKGDKENG